MPKEKTVTTGLNNTLRDPKTGRLYEKGKTHTLPQRLADRDKVITGDLTAEEVQGRDYSAGEAPAQKQTAPPADPGEGNADELPSLSGDIPEDFARAKVLSNNGVQTFAQLEANLDSLEDLNGIGDDYAAEIRADYEERRQALAEAEEE